MTKPTIIQTSHYVQLRVALALAIVYASVVKLGGMRQFADGLGDFGLLPDALVLPTACGKRPTAAGVQEPPGRSSRG